MPEVKWVLREDEFAAEMDLAGPTRSSPTGAAAGDARGELQQAVRDALPKVLGRRIEAIWNAVEGFELVSFDVKVGVEGKPFGVGIEGETSLHFVRAKGAIR